MRRPGQRSPAGALSGAVEETERWWRNTPGLTRAEAVERLSAFAWRGANQLSEHLRDEPGRDPGFDRARPGLRRSRGIAAVASRR